MTAKALALAGEIATRGKDQKKADSHFNEAIKITIQTLKNSLLKETPSIAQKI